jgi:hypothetical protein
MLRKTLIVAAIVVVAACSGSQGVPRKVKVVHRTVSAGRWGI